MEKLSRCEMFGFGSPQSNWSWWTQILKLHMKLTFEVLEVDNEQKEKGINRQRSRMELFEMPAFGMWEEKAKPRILHLMAKAKDCVEK